MEASLGTAPADAPFPTNSRQVVGSERRDPSSSPYYMYCYYMQYLLYTMCCSPSHLQGQKSEKRHPQEGALDSVKVPNPKK